MKKTILILLTLIACEVPCRRNGATAADEPGLVAVWCADGDSNCICVPEGVWP